MCMRNVILGIVAALVAVVGLGFGYIYFLATPDDGLYEQDWQIAKMTKTINKALDNSVLLKRGNIETEILRGSYGLKNPPNRITAAFSVDEETKEEANVEFKAKYYYDEYVEDFDIRSKHYGLYLNVYYPYTESHAISPDRVESIEKETIKEGTRYTVTYSGPHTSRRMEWEYCQVVNDYEVFVIDEQGVISRYESVTYYKTQGGVAGKSGVTTKMSNYELL